MGGETIGAIQVIATINTKDYDAAKKKIESGNKSLEKSNSNADESFSKFSKVVATGAAAATVAVGAFFATSIKGFATYEQVVGGAQKIFDEIDYSKIQADAQGAYKTMNISATDYLKTINDVGAGFASSMGDAKGYETAKQGLQALSDYATGTGKDIDILSGKFVAIAKAQTSYVTIADQFAGILPASSQAFIDQATAAGFLEKGYKELTDIPIAEYQQALASMLELGTKNLGLQGNAAYETEKTISGSFAGMTASWSNFTSALASGDIGVTKTALMNLGTTGTAFLNNVWKAAQNIVTTFGQLFNEFLAANPALAFTLDLLKNLAIVIGSLLLPQIVKYIALQTLAGAAAIAAGAKMFIAWTLALGPIGLLIAAIIALTTIIVTNSNTVGKVFGAVWQGMVNYAVKSIAMIVKAAASLLAPLVAPFRMALANIKSLFSGIAPWFSGLWTKVTGIFKAAGNAIGNAVGGAFKAAINGAITMVQNALNAPINAINGAIGQINKLPGVDIGKIPTLNLPKLAKGGIVSSATIAMIGEGSEPEAVIPLSKLDKMLDSDGKGKSIEYNIGTINIDNEADGEKWLRRLTNDTEITSAGLTPQQRYM